MAIPKYLEYKRGKIFGNIHFSTELEMHKQNIMNHRGIVGKIKLSLWVKEHQEQINRLIHSLGKEKSVHFIDVLASINVKDKKLFLQKMEELSNSNISKELFFSFVETLSRSNIEEKQVFNFLRLIKESESNLDLINIYSFLFKRINYYGIKKFGSGIFTLFEFSRKILIESKSKEISEALQDIFELFFKSNNLKSVDYGKNVLFIFENLIKKNRFPELFEIIRKTKDIYYVSEILSKFSIEKLQRNSDLIITALRNPIEDAKIKELERILKNN